MEQKVGAGFVIWSGGKEAREQSFRLADKSTVFQAEIAAILKAADHMLSDPTSLPRFAKFCVDSQAALLALCAQEISSKLV